MRQKLMQRGSCCFSIVLLRKKGRWCLGWQSTRHPDVLPMSGLWVQPICCIDRLNSLSTLAGLGRQLPIRKG